MKTVTVFRTSVTTPDHAAQLKASLDQLFENDECWNFDLEDSENILRVESKSAKAILARQLLTDSGFYCEELED